MIKIDPRRINILRHIAGGRRRHAEALAQVAAAELHEIDAVRGEIRKVARRHERTGGATEELAQLRRRQQAAQSRHAEASEQAEAAHDNARIARKLLTRCEDFVDTRAGGGNGV